MKRVVVVLVLLAGTLAWADAKPTTIRLAVEKLTAVIALEKGGKLTLTNKPQPIKPETYWVSGISLVKNDEKGKAWELRSNGTFGSDANITVEAEQEKVMLLGKGFALVVEGKPAEDPPGNKVVAVSVVIRGMDSEMYFPWAYVDGKNFTMPNVAIKDESGKVLASGASQLREGRYAWFTWKHPAGWEGKYDVEVQAFLGPFECKLSKSIQSMKQP